MTELFHETTREIHLMGSLNDPVHLKLGMWFSNMASKGDHSVLQDVGERVELKKVLVPRSSLLFNLDPVNSLSLDEMR